MNGASITTEAPKTVIVEKFKVSRYGGGANGHPRVRLQIPNEHGWGGCYLAVDQPIKCGFVFAILATQAKGCKVVNKAAVADTVVTPVMVYR